MSVVNAKCPNCGASIQLDNERSEGFCSYCGSKVKVEEAQKLMIQGTVKVDTSDELANLYQIARRAKDADNSENAHKYYDMILVKDPNSWEATFYVTYYQAMQCKIAEIASAGDSVANCIPAVIELVKNNLSEEEQSSAVTELFIKCNNISCLLSSAAKSHYNDIDESIRADYTQEFINNTAAAARIMYGLGDCLEEHFGEEHSAYIVTSWSSAIDMHNSYLAFLLNKEVNMKIMREYGNRIKKYDSQYTLPEFKQSNGCYVATAIYGSYNCPEVWVLRRFRDNTLDNYLIGRWFIRTYYAISPTLVKYFGNTSLFRAVLTPVLDRFVSLLKNRGTSDKPYNDKY